MNTESLQYFIKVYEKKSISSAAKDLFITPQGLSKTIKQLEMELEAELFYRESHGMEATEYGELLYARAKHICYLLEDIKKEFSIVDAKKDILNVIVTYAATYAIPPDLLFCFSKLYPNIQMKLKEIPDEYPFDTVFKKEADIGLVMGNQELEDCKYELIVPGELVVMVSKDNPLAATDEVSITQLKSEQFVLKSVESGKEHRFIEACEKFGFHPDVKQETGNMGTAHILCEKSGLVAISVDFIEESILNERLKMIRLKEKIPQNIYMVSKKDDAQSKAVTAFRNYVKQHCMDKDKPIG